MILLDTKVLSEALRRTPATSVIEWLDARCTACAISSITIFELGAGLALLLARKRRDTLETAIVRIVRRFGARVYAFGTPSAHAAAKLLGSARVQALGLHQVPEKLADLRIAGIASAYRPELAARDIADFQGTGLLLINPWDVASA